MDTLRSTGLQLEHRHSDGSWSRLEREPHDTAERDPERSWLGGLLFRCKSCDERVRVTTTLEAEATTDVPG